MNGFGLVLAGGGAKGSYEVGVWKALRELDIPIAAVTGTSVGALNGAMVVQGDFNAAYSMWTKISTDDVIKIDKDIIDSKNAYMRPLSILTAIKDALASGGLDITPLSNILNNLIDEDKIRKSPTDLGIVTFSLSDLEPIQIFKDDIPHGKLIDYLLASACFPAFRPQQINDKKFIDGGVYDNIPISLMLKKGIKNIIVADISGVGFNRKLNKDDLSDINIIKIKNSDYLGKTMEFNSEQAKANIEYGYLDTLRVFGKLSGNKYYITLSPLDEDINFDYKSLDISRICDLFGIDYSNSILPVNKIIIGKIFNLIDKYMDGDEKNSKAIYKAATEITAAQLGIERKKAYKLDELKRNIIDKYNAITGSRDFEDYVNNMTMILSKLDMGNGNMDNINNQNILKKVRGINREYLPIYLADPKNNSEKFKILRKIISLTSPKIMVAAVYLFLLNKDLNNEQ